VPACWRGALFFLQSTRISGDIAKVSDPNCPKIVIGAKVNDE
jgi:hypothetical protein